MKTYTAKEYLTVIVSSMVGSLVCTWFTCVDCRVSPVHYLIVAAFSMALWILLWIGNDWLVHYLNDRISWVTSPVKRLVVGLLVTILYTSSVVLLVIAVWELATGETLGDSEYIVYFSLVITFLISLFLHGREFLLRWRTAAIEAERFQKESAKAQYESLRNQVNPHFLFNSLNALTNLVYEDQDKAARFIKQLSEVYRYVLETRNQEVVTLQEELAFLESYLYLQRIRFGQKLQVEINLSGVRTHVAPLAIQMLIENAIKHTVISEQEPLHIRVFCEDSWIVVSNNLNPKSVIPGESAGVGLDNIRRRYAYLGQYRVLVEKKESEFVVRLPFINWNEDRNH
ncbi:MAG TPA: histidine kinase [Cyclobacteriaceae bacterium]|nr:histidine kinase [Cyclobacteriaceae bacterium]